MSQYEPGSIMRVFRQDWGCYHFGIVGTNDDVIHDTTEFPDMIVEISTDGGKEWCKAPLFDYVFLKRTWDIDGGLGHIQMRQITKGIV